MQLIQSMTTTTLIFRWLLMVTCGTAILLPGSIMAADPPAAGPESAKVEDQPILIEADQLVSYNEKKFAEFIGNVKASQADFVITSDRLRIYYQGELLETEGTRDQDEELLRKIVASGNVKIKSSQYSAESETVEYDTQSMTITMTGDGSKVISGKNSITGSKIILYRKDGRVKVIGSKKQRVEAMFYSGSSASDAFKIEKSKEQ